MAKNGPYTEDKYQFRYNFINQVPPGVALITKNTLTGEVKNAEDENSGVSFLPGMKAVVTTKFPWIQTKYVTILPKTIEYLEFAYDTKDRIRLVLDLSCEVIIANPAKFEYASLTINKQLKSTVDSSIRRVMVSNVVDTIMDKSFDLFNAIKSDLDAFKLEYGLEVSKLKIKNIKLPEGARKSYEQKLTSTADADRIKTVGSAEAQIIKEKAKAKREGQLEVIEQLIETMQKSGLPKEQIAEAVSGAVANMFLDISDVHGYVSIDTDIVKKRTK